MFKVFTREGKKIRQFIVRHALIFGLSGTVALVILYYNILDARNALAGGYFSDPFLTTATEFTWFIMAAFIYLSINGVRALVKHHKKRKKK